MASVFVVELLCVGNELLSGITVNTNAHWLAGQIAKAGGIVSRTIVVRDDLDAISTAVQEALGRNPDILITTGGLGATYDDLTLEGVAMALGRKVSINKTAAEMLKRSYARRHLNYKINRVRLKMATIPEGSTPIENPVGSAPSVMMGKIFCLPGVPAEMKLVFKKHILPLVREGVGKYAAKEANYNVTGVSETMLATTLVRIVRSNPKHAVYLKTHPRGYKKTTPRIRVQIICRGDDAVSVGKRLGRISKIILKKISELGGSIE